MPEQVCYEFNGFRLDPARQSLHHSGQPRSLTPRSFALLNVFVQNHGKTLSRAELIRHVWADSFVTDNNFNVNLNAVRRALGESARQPRYIFKVSGGYSFVAEVRETHTTPIDQPATEQIDDPGLPPAHTSTQMNDRNAPDLATTQTDAHGQEGQRTNQWETEAGPKEIPTTENSALKRLLWSPTLSWQIGIASMLYALLYSAALVLEIAYQFDRFGSSALKIAPLVFVWITISSVAGLAIDQKLTSQDRAGGLIASAAIFLIAAAALFVFLTRYLPATPITESNLQSYPAQAAYLKDTLYFLGLVFCFLIVPFHFIVSAERDIRRSKCDQLLDLLGGNKLSVSLKGAIYPRLWALWLLLIALLALSLAMTSRLLDNLKPGPYTNLFTQLVYLRGLLYFGLALECLAWYNLALNRVKRECLDHLNRAS